MATLFTILATLIGGGLLLVVLDAMFSAPIEESDWD